MNEQPEINFNNHAQALTAKRNYWRKIIRQWQSNPIRARDFCKLKDLNLDQFSYWRHKFTKIDDSTISSPVGKEKPGFIEVVAETNNAIDAKLSVLNIESTLQITLPNNIQLTITVPISLIKEFITELGAIKC